MFGTIFSYFEYTAKQTKSVTSMDHVDCEREKQHFANPSFRKQETTVNCQTQWTHFSKRDKLCRL